MKNKFIFHSFSFLLLFLFAIPWLAGEEGGIGELLTRMEAYLRDKNFTTYLNVFSPEIRAAEESALKSIYNSFQMNTVTFHKASQRSLEDGRVRVYFQVLYQNKYSAIIETWRIILFHDEKSWTIEKKDVIGNVSRLYKIKMPSTRAERVKSIEVRSVDIKISFRDAMLFYDNIPDMETALIIIGKGRLYFSPSDTREQHQLQLIYKKKVLEDNLKYAYLRFSDNFFRKGIKIERMPGEKTESVSRVEVNKAHSIFTKHYPYSFTVESSISGELFSFLPQGEQVVLDFQGEKVGSLTYIYSPFAKEEVSLYDRKEERLINIYSPSGEEKKKKLFISFEQKFDIENYQIDIDYDPQHSFLSGKATIELRSQFSQLSNLNFRLSPELDILRIFDEEKNELFYTQDKMRKNLYVYLLHRYSQNKTYKIEIYYRGKLEPPDHKANVLHEAQMSFDRRGKSYSVHASRFFNQSAYWYPSPPDVDYFKARIRIIIPNEYGCVATGELKEYGKLDDVKGVEGIDKLDNAVYTFETMFPVKHLSFIVGKFSKIGENSEVIPIDLFASSKTGIQKKELLGETKDILRFYQGRFGPFPYEKLSIVQRFWLLTGGHSPASFIVLNEIPRRTLQPGYYLKTKSDSPVDLSQWKEYFLAHEIAHQWWGQGVASASYHDQWLSEGLAQFSAMLYMKEKRGRGIFSQILRKFTKWTEKKSVKGPVTLGSRLSHYDYEAYQTIIYNKTSLVLNMLRDMLGEEVFFNGLKEFFNHFKYGAVRTKDFVQTMEKVSGKDLGSFFNAWFDSHLLPEVRVSHSFRKNDEGYLLRLKFTQVKGPFVFPLFIEWKEKGQKIIKKVIISKKIEEFEFQTREKAEKIKINPDKAVPGKFS